MIRKGYVVGAFRYINKANIDEELAEANNHNTYIYTDSGVIKSDYTMIQFEGMLDAKINKKVYNFVIGIAKIYYTKRIDRKLKIGVLATMMAFTMLGCPCDVKAENAEVKVSGSWNF